MLRRVVHRIIAPFYYQSSIFKVCKDDLVSYIATVMIFFNICCDIADFVSSGK